MYVVFGTPYGPDKGFYSPTTAATPSTLERPRLPASSGYQWWFGRIWVDPDDQNHLFNADVNLRTSTNGGTTWTAISGPHSDQHAMDWDPHHARPRLPRQRRRHVPLRHQRRHGLDVGRKASNQPWNQCYHLAVSQQDPQRHDAGLQDNGSVSRLDRRPRAVADRSGADELERLRRR